jgi:MFS family permease
VYRNFYLFLVSRFVSGTALTLMRAAIAWHVYSLSRSAFHLGLIGLVQFVPVLTLTLVGGAAADSYDRRRIIQIAQVVAFMGGAQVLWATQQGHGDLWHLYATVLGISCAMAFESPARMALMPTLVEREVFARAVTVSSTNQALAFASGPAVAGLIIAAWGITAAYATFCGLLVVSIATMAVVTLREDALVVRRAISVAAIREGLQFVWRQPVVLGCMALDMFAVVFGSAQALLPVYANDILQVGPRGYGLLTAALDVGAFAMSIVLLLRPTVRRAGVVLLATVAAYGVATVAFGLSRSFPLSLALYMLVGMADQVSVVMRATAIQLSTPDELRGRVSAVSMLFIGASNQLGATRAGFVADGTSAPFAVVSGGLVCLLVVAWVALRVPALRGYEVPQRDLRA